MNERKMKLDWLMRIAAKIAKHSMEDTLLQRMKDSEMNCAVIKSGEFAQYESTDGMRGEGGVKTKSKYLNKTTNCKRQLFV